MSYPALFRNDRGGLEVRHYPTAADAARVSAEREIAPASSTKGIVSHEFARRLGLHPKTIRRYWSKGDLPGIQHGPRTLIIPHHVCRLISIYGLWGYVQMRAAGKV